MRDSAKLKCIAPGCVNDSPRRPRGVTIHEVEEWWSVTDIARPARSAGSCGRRRDQDEKLSGESGPLHQGSNGLDEPLDGRAVPEWPVQLDLQNVCVDPRLCRNETYCR
jgi:hypothetical protein